MSRRVLLPRNDVCRLCQAITGPRKTPRLQNFIRNGTGSSRRLSTVQTSPTGKIQNSIAQRQAAEKGFHPSSQGVHNQFYKSPQPTEAELNSALREVRATCDRLLSGGLPSEAATIHVLGRCLALAELLLIEPAAPSLKKTAGPANALLSLDDQKRRITPQNITETMRQIAEELSGLAYSIIKHPPVFISPNALKLYVQIMAILRKPKELPEVLELYSSKPVPVPGSSPIRYKSQNPNKVANAIPQSVADNALQTAIAVRDLDVAMGIVEASYTTKAFHRAKFMRKAALPTTGLAVSPFAAYALASSFAGWQSTMDPTVATSIAFTGMMAYVTFTSTLGLVAITTANDHMDRVTWQQGVPLTERWIREEERAAIDKMADAWGFRESWRRGEEEGKDWEDLREWIGLRSMVLDSVDSMADMR